MTDGPYRQASEREPDEPAPDPQRPWVLQTWMSSRECPNCAVSLFAARQEGYRIDACGACGGAWLDHDVTKRAIEERSLMPARLSEMAAERAGRNAEMPNRTCPVCATKLTPTVVPEARVVIDVCAAHGAWFDPDEARSVIEGVVRQQPTQLGPEVDREIARAAVWGAFRPPKDYQPGDNLSLSGALAAVIEAATRNRIDKE